MHWTLILVLDIVANMGRSAHMQSVSCQAGSLCLVRKHEVCIMLPAMVRWYRSSLLTMWMLLDYRSIRNDRQMTTGRSRTVISKADQLKLILFQYRTLDGAFWRTFQLVFKWIRRSVIGCSSGHVKPYSSLEYTDTMWVNGYVRQQTRPTTLGMSQWPSL